MRLAARVPAVARPAAAVAALERFVLRPLAAAVADAAALAKATGPTPGRRGRTGIAVASQRRRAPAQPSPALAAAAQDFSAPPPDQRGKK